jgi:hypothetical protein
LKKRPLAFRYDKASPPWLDDESSDFDLIGNILPATTVGEPFEIEIFTGAFRGFGTMLFSPDTFQVEARPFKHSGGLATPIHEKTPLWLILLDILKWKQPISFKIENDQLSIVSLKGRTLVVGFAGSANYRLVIAKADGERLYREVFLRFPLDFPRWAGKL